MLLTQPPTAAKTNRRCAKMKWCEIVRVDSTVFLVNARQQACRYETADGEPLAPGYYLALWPGEVDLSFYDHELQYLGPFTTKAEACLLQTSALGLGIVEMEMEDMEKMTAIAPAPPVPLQWQPLHLAADLTRAPSRGELAYQGA